MYHPFSIPETIKASWSLMKRNFITIIVYSFIAYILLSVLTVVIAVLFPTEEYWAQVVVAFLTVFVQAYTTLGLYKLIFTLIDSEYHEFAFKQTVPTLKMVFSYLGVECIIAFVVGTFIFITGHLEDGSILQNIVFVIGFAAIIYLTLRIMFFNTFIVDDHSGGIESIRQSFSLTKGYMLKVLVILVIIIVLIFIPAKLSQYYPYISLAIVFTYPFVNIILAVTYRKLVYSHQDVDDDVAETN